MKTVIKAALLLSVSFFFSQASLAGGNGNGKPDKDVPPPKDDCTFHAVALDCAYQLDHAYDMLVTNVDAFKNARDYGGLTCKVAASDMKIAEDKPQDAELKLSDSVMKIETLVSQGKINDYYAAMDMAEAMERARACAESLTPATP